MSAPAGHWSAGVDLCAQVQTCAAIECQANAFGRPLLRRTKDAFGIFLRTKQSEIRIMPVSITRSSVLATVVAMATTAAASAQYNNAPNWTGPYLGASVGAGTAKTIWSAADFETSSKGAIGGVQTGYNWQTGSVVLGVEGDYLFSNAKGSVDCLGGSTCSSTTHGLGTLRGRLGWAIAPPAMLYFTGGLAWGNTEWSAMPNTGGTQASFSHASRGTAFGGGAEYMLSSNWTLKAEYLHYNLGTVHAGGGDFLSGPVDLKTRADTFKLGVNFKF
jgi:outer membrane immunogenic protein